MNCGAGNESRTRDLNLGKVALYQLSYSRVEEICYFNDGTCLVKRKIEISLGCWPEKKSTRMPFQFVTDFMYTMSTDFSSNLLTAGSVKQREGVSGKSQVEYSK